MCSVKASGRTDAPPLMDELVIEAAPTLVLRERRVYAAVESDSVVDSKILQLRIYCC